MKRASLALNAVRIETSVKRIYLAPRRSTRPQRNPLSAQLKPPGVFHFSPSARAYLFVRAFQSAKPPLAPFDDTQCFNVAANARSFVFTPLRDASRLKDAESVPIVATAFRAKLPNAQNSGKAVKKSLEKLADSPIMTLEIFSFKDCATRRFSKITLG